MHGHTQLGTHYSRITDYGSLRVFQFTSPRLVSLGGSKSENADRRQNTSKLQNFVFFLRKNDIFLSNRWFFLGNQGCICVL